MISFKNFPKKNHITYTIIHRYQAKTLSMALKIAGETDYRITTRVTETMKPHIPDWFNLKYAILISRFDSQFLLNQMGDIMEDEDVSTAIDNQLAENAHEHEVTHKWVETEGVKPWGNRT